MRPAGTSLPVLFALAAGPLALAVASSPAHAQHPLPRLSTVAVGGKWEGPFQLSMAVNGEIVHAVYLPPNTAQPSTLAGQTLFFNNQYPNCNAPIDPTDHTRSWLWDPANPAALSAPLDVPNSQFDHLWCSGHALTPAGDVLAFGGTDMTQPCYTGSAGIYRWTPSGWSLAGQLDALAPRWYPSVLELAVPDGDLLILGHQSLPAGPERTHQIFYVQSGTTSPLFDNLEAGGLCQVTGNVVAFTNYPWAHWINAGTVYVTGPEAEEKYFGCRQPDGSFRWTPSLKSSRNRWDGNSVQRLDWTATGRREQIFILGGMTALNGPGAKSGDCDWNVARTVESVENPRPGVPAPWSQRLPLLDNRRHAVTLPLPDGTLLTVGGAGWVGPADSTGQQVARVWPEAFDPVLNTRARFNPQIESRNYHSIAFLMLDGRVVSAGGIDAPHSLEIFSPPYLFHGPRPTIQTAPATIALCASAPPSCGTFEVTVTLGQSSDPITKVSLLRPASVTHGVDCNQRYVELPILAQSQPDPGGQPLTWKLDVQLPESIDVTPPGWYMLFAVSAAGIPAVGQFVSIP